MSSPVYCIDSITWYDAGSVALSFRERGPCAIYPDGTVYFAQLSRFSYNRRAGPAIISPNGYVRHHNKHGQYHRADGPAIIHEDGNKEYWIDNNQYFSEEFFVKYGVI